MRQGVLITGASGLLGYYLLQTAPRTYSLHACTRSRALSTHQQHRVASVHPINLASQAAVESLRTTLHVSAIIHAAAMAQPALCEQHPEAAQQDNVKATRNLLAWAVAEDIPFVFCSTDCVFDGTASPYSEHDPVAPVGVYARTKVEAEQLVNAYGKGLSVRLPLLLGYSPTGRSASHSLINALQSGQRPSLFVDEFRTPLHAWWAAHYCWQAVQQMESFPHAERCLHLAGTERVSRYSLGCAIASRAGFDPQQIQASTLKSYTGQPARLPDTSLRTTRLSTWLGVRAPTLSESLALPLA